MTSSASAQCRSADEVSIQQRPLAMTWKRMTRRAPGTKSAAKSLVGIDSYAHGSVYSP
jgi:hypothetical protein